MAKKKTAKKTTRKQNEQAAGDALRERAKHETKEIEGGEIKRTNRMYVALREIGQCNEKGRSVLALGYKGKFIAEPERPFETLVIPLLDEILNFVNYTDREAGAADLETLKTYINGLEFK